MTDYAAVLAEKHPGREWTLNANDYEQLVMLDGGAKPSQASLDAAWPEVRQILAARRAAAENVRTSALAKLAALGLSEAEVAALLG